MYRQVQLGEAGTNHQGLSVQNETQRLCCNPPKPRVNIVVWFTFPERASQIVFSGPKLSFSSCERWMLWEPRRWNWGFRRPGQRVCDTQYWVLTDGT